MKSSCYHILVFFLGYFGFFFQLFFFGFWHLCHQKSFKAIDLITLCILYIMIMFTFSQNITDLNIFRYPEVSLPNSSLILSEIWSVYYRPMLPLIYLWIILFNFCTESIWEFLFGFLFLPKCLIFLIFRCKLCLSLLVSLSGI